MYGHDHSEKFNVLRAHESKKPIGVSYWTSSLTPYEDVNPSFRILEVDEETMLPYKATTYYIDLRAKNPVWKARHEYT